MCVCSPFAMIKETLVVCKITKFTFWALRTDWNILQ